MRNRLTFPEGGLETKYVWDKYSLNNNGIYIWDKHNVDIVNEYHWDKYSLKQKEYKWSKYEYLATTNYNWERYPQVYTEDDYLIYKRPLEDTARSKYLNLTASVSTTIRTNYAYDKSRTKIYLFKTDNTVDEYSVADILNNDEMMTTLLRYGYCGFNVLASSTMPAFFFTASTTMEKSADGTQIVFSEIYGQYTNTTAKIKDLTTTPTGSYYIEYNMRWVIPTILDVQSSPKTGTKPAPSSYKVGDYFYDFINDGFWKKAVGGYKNDLSNKTILTSTDPNAYPTGVTGDYYYYKKIANTTTYSKGDFIEYVKSETAGTYPDNGYQDGYWYELVLEGTWYWDRYTNVQYIWDYYTKGNTKYLSSATAYKTPYKEPETISLNMWRKVRNDEDVPDDDTFTIQYDVSGIEAFTSSVYAFELDPDNLNYMMNLEDTDPLHADNIIRFTYYMDVGQKYKVQDISNLYLWHEGVYETSPRTYYIITADTTIEKISQSQAVFNHLTVINFSKGYGVPYAGMLHPTKAYVEGDYGSPDRVRYDSEYINGNYDKYYVYYYRRAFTINNPRAVISSNSQEMVSITPETPEYQKICDRIPNPSSLRFNDYTTVYFAGYRYRMTNLDFIQGPIGESKGIYTAYNNKNAYQDGPDPNNSTRWIVYRGATRTDESFWSGEVSSNNQNAYPNDGEQDGYWYILTSFDSENYEIDEFLEEITSFYKNSYPEDGPQAGYWYKYKFVETFYYRGDFIDTVATEMITSYPKDGKKDDYWYVYKGFENNGPYKSKWIQQVESNQANAFPQDGINGYYWYVYNKSYEGYKYQINDEQIRGGIDYKHTINPEEDYTIGCVASAEIELDYDNRNNDIENYLDFSYCDYYTWQPNDEDWRLIGRFYLDNVNHNRKLVNIKAFDAIGIDGDTFMDAFIEATTFPISVRQFFTNICSTLGYECSIDSSLVNLDFQLQDNFEAINITARQLLQYVAEMCAGFVRVDKNNVITLRSYKTKDLDLNNSQYTKTSVANYTTEKVSSLTVRTTNDDLGVSAGNGDNKYIIENNPLFYAQSNDEIQKEVNNIYNKLREVSYVPADIELLQDFGIECGDIITLNGATFYVMEKEISASGCKLKCVGNKVRAQQESGINSDIVALRGKTNELYRDLEMTKSTLTDTEKGLQSQITQTAEEINLRVTNEVEGLESEISQTAEQISLRVTNEVAGLESKITQTADSITSTVTDQINETKSEIKQTTDSISLQVDSQGELVAQLVLDVNGINARGYVTFTDLAGTGTTVINGSNITTGTISADRINMRGAISWGDLDEDCKDTIASYAGQDGDDADVPDYIHNTYIDATRIVSPTIQGGTLSAGTTADGYMKLSSTGLNFHSSEKAICGIGYYSGNKELPYIVMGAGVDDYGTDQGMIKKYTNGIWIGDSDGLESNSPTGTGIFINFNTGAVQKYVNGSASAL